MKLSEVVGVVTGGAAGLGRAFADKILANGGCVLITDINEVQLQTTGAMLAAKYGARQVCWQHQDVADPTSFHRMIAHASQFFQRAVNLLINNAGIMGGLQFWQDDAPRSWESVVEIDLTAVLRGSQVAIQQFRQHLGGKEGVVINISSFAGLDRVPVAPEYAAAKAGVVGFTRSCHHLQKQDNIRVVALCPSFTDTEMGRAGAKQYTAWMESQGGLMPVDAVVAAFKSALEDERNPGRVIRIMPRSSEYFSFPGDKQLYTTAQAKL